MPTRIMSEEYLELLIPSELAFAYERFGDIVQINDRISMFTVPTEILNECSISEFYYSSFPTLFVPTQLELYEDTQIRAVRNNPNLNLLGRDVIIGFIDTGIDYTHEAFKNPDNTTRIYSIWDQTIESETPQEGIIYGTEYSREQINEALASEDPFSVVPSRDEVGHGTQMAGIAAGNIEEEKQFSGIAPQAEIVVVKLKPAKQIIKKIFFVREGALCYQESDILFGTKYITELAERLRKPVVLCIGLGTSQGGHDGRGALSSYLSTTSTKPGECAVIAAGNEANLRRHYRGTIPPTTRTDTFELRIAAQDTSFGFELWEYSLQRVSIEIISPSGERIGPIFPGIKECIENRLVFESTIIWVNNIITETETGTQLILVRFRNATEGIWQFRITSLAEQYSVMYDVWLPMGDIISEDTYFLQSDPNITITSPGNAPLSMTITSYDSLTGAIAVRSGRGFTRIGTVKPDLAAPGVNLPAPLPGNQYGTFSGTSAAASVGAGCAALLFEWAMVRGNYPNINGNEIKTLLIRGARQSPGIDYPSPIWGYGKIDVLNVFENIIKFR